MARGALSSEVVGAMEVLYRSGLTSVPDIAKQYGIASSTVFKYAKQCGWDRDLSGRATYLAERRLEHTKGLLDEDLILETLAEQQAKVLAAERGDIERLNLISNKLIAELEQCGESTKEKTFILKQLTDVRKTLIELRRRNYMINDNANGNANMPEPVTAITINYV